jgi:hypothetical protein
MTLAMFRATPLESRPERFPRRNDPPLRRAHIALFNRSKNPRASDADSCLKMPAACLNNEAIF